MVQFFIEGQDGASQRFTYFVDTDNGSFIANAGTTQNHQEYQNHQSLDEVAWYSVEQATTATSGIVGPWISAHMPIKYYEVLVPINQKVDVYFYPDLNVSDVIVNQKVDVYFYPDNNVTVPVINQEVQIQFYADGNVTDPDPLAVNQEVKIEFYPDGNVSDVIDPVIVDGFKFWFGMRGKKRYGRGLSKRISF